MKVAAVLAFLCSLVAQGDGEHGTLAAQSAARCDYWLGEFFEYRAREGVAWMQAGDDEMLANITRVLKEHDVGFACEGSLAWWADVLPWDAPRARAALLADPATRSAVR